MYGLWHVWLLEQRKCCMNELLPFIHSFRVHSAIENRREGAFTLTCVSGSACPPAGNLTRRRDALRPRSSGVVMRSAARRSAGAAPRRAAPRSTAQHQHQHHTHRGPAEDLHQGVSASLIYTFRLYHLLHLFSFFLLLLQHHYHILVAYYYYDYDYIIMIMIMIMIMIIIIVVIIL